MTLAQVEQKLTRLEREIERLKRSHNGNAPRDGKWWVAQAGAFADDAGYDEMARLGAQYRQSLKPKARKRRR